MKAVEGRAFALEGRLGKFSDDQRQLVRERADIVQIIGERVPLERKGSRFAARCPFHEEKTPSFSVDPAKGVFYCFGCKKGGDVFTFVMEFERVGFKDALRIVAQKTGIEIEPESPGDRERKSRRAAALDALRRVAELYSEHLWRDDQVARRATDFLERRGVKPETAQLFLIGVAPPGSILIGNAKKLGLSPTLLEELKLVQRGRDGSTYDFFRDRLIFPIRDEGGRVVGFGGRTLLTKEEIEQRQRDGRHVAKFTNSYELEGIFEKRRLLYGIDQVRALSPRPKRLVVVEGYLDVVICHQEGAKNVVAALGTGFTRDHAKLAKRFADAVTILFDGDRAGEAAARRALEELVQEPLDLSVALLPKGDDPDDFILREKQTKFESLVDSARELVDHLVDAVLADKNQGSVGRAKSIESVARVIGKIQDDVRLHVVLPRVAGRLGFPEDVLREQVARARVEARNAPAYPRPSIPGEPVRPHGGPPPPPPFKVDATVKEALGGLAVPGDMGELMVIEAFLAHPRALANESVTPELFADGPLRAIARALCDEARVGSVPEAKDEAFAARVLARLEGDVERDACGRLIARIASTPLNYEGHAVVQRLVEKRERDRRESLNQRLREAQARGDKEEVDRLLREKFSRPNAGETSTSSGGAS